MMKLPTLKVLSMKYLVSGIKNTKYKILNTKYSKSFGFSLIELLVVITIVSILISLATVSYTKAQQKGRDGKRKSDLKSIQQMMELYFQKYGKYPPAYDDGSNEVQGDDDIGHCQYLLNPGDTWTPFVAGSSTQPGSLYPEFTNTIPKDPRFLTNQGYIYWKVSNSSYRLAAQLENTNDPDRVTLSGWPGFGCTSGQNYEVLNP